MLQFIYSVSLFSGEAVHTEDTEFYSNNPVSSGDIIQLTSGFYHYVVMVTHSSDLNSTLYLSESYQSPEEAMLLKFDPEQLLTLLNQSLAMKH